MPGSIRSIRTLESILLQYESDEEPALTAGKPLFINQASRSRASLVQLPPSPADSELNDMRAPTQPTAEERRLTRQIDRGAPGDGAIFSDKKTPEQKELAKRKSQYYGDVFANREPNTSAKERISRDSMIVADIRTNVIIQDEYTFITDLSYALSGRFQRPESCIVVTVVHSACLLYAGNFDPAYTMTITALPSQLRPVTNKRNAALLAKSMEDGLGVTPERGLIKFIPIPEENFAIGGQTVAGAIEELDRQHAEENANLKSNLSTSKAAKRQSMKSLRLKKVNSNLPTHEERMTPPNSGHDANSPPLPSVPTVPSKMDLKAERVQKMGRRKSFMAAVFGK